MLENCREERVVCTAWVKGQGEEQGEGFMKVLVVELALLIKKKKMSHRQKQSRHTH